ncbi:ImmA/IrrE family metallo-endopeptidase [Streptomyces inhibens]|uniref:ImmA/IrrE family metallo-endopeptidase n=1 Tax=Streptomyces inhibens TaxID=2293571 RepID=UPI001EE6F556|nr:ImmA/IrrE family metallo-endopeptidase [Streptomyces inhibens]UKY54747.1 ImmA/IrrE family metallo-endopeptidase [Streptomyces inhibens]
MVVLAPSRADDVLRYRFSAAHELGHLVLHSSSTGDSQQEREADTFAAEFLTPQRSLRPLLPQRVDLSRLAVISPTWGVSVSSLIYRYREFGLVSDATISRAYQRLRALSTQPGFAPESVRGFPGEQPVMLQQACELAASDTGLTIRELSQELAWKPARVRELLGMPDTRPVLRLL